MKNWPISMMPYLKLARPLNLSERKSNLKPPRNLLQRHLKRHLPKPANPMSADTSEQMPKAESKGKSEPKAQPMMSEAQKRAIYNLSRRRGISVEQLEQMVADAYGCDLESLTSGDASAFIRQLQQAA